jgi:hypothetical protein
MKEAVKKDVNITGVSEWVSHTQADKELKVYSDR